MIPDSSSPWLVCLKPERDPRIRLLCFPSAGSGSAVYAPWVRHLPPQVELWAALFPGRETRIAEPPVSVLSELVDHVYIACQPLAALPIAVFGHSMGSTVGFEVCRRLVRDAGAKLVHLFLSGFPSPAMWQTWPRISHLPDQEFVTVLHREFDSIPEAILRDPKWLAPFLPALRADILAIESHRFVPGDTLSIPMTVMFGRADAHAGESQVADWRSHTSATFELVPFDGGHFYLNRGPARRRVISLVLERVESGLA